MNPGLVILIGMGVVFSGLILLIVAIAVMNGLIGAFGGKEEKKEDAVPAKADRAPEEIDHDALIVVIASSIAAATDTDAAGLKILSIKRI